MQLFIVLVSCLGLASAGLMKMDNYGGDGGSGGNAGYGGDGGYGGSKKQCRTVFHTVEKEHCEPYTNRICMTTHKESCMDKAGKNCHAIVTTSSTRQCFDVTETKCTLKEDVKFETVDVPFVVQKCTKVNGKILNLLIRACLRNCSRNRYQH